MTETPARHGRNGKTKSRTAQKTQELQASVDMYRVV
jgi:hypothetical protein